MTAPHRKEQREALLALLEHSLARGHRRLAIRRYLMLCWQGHVVPPHLRAACNRLVVESPGPEFGRVSRQVRAWQRMLAKDYGGDSPTASASSS